MELNYIGAGLALVTFKLSDGETYEAWGAVNAEGAPESEVIEIRGDDQKLGEFITDQTEALTLEFNALSFDVLQAITGNNYASSAEGLEIPVGTDSEQNPPIVEVTAKSLARSKTGDTGYFYKTWHKLQIKSPQITQAQGSELAVSMEGIGYKTDKDVVGATLSPARTATWRFEPNQVE